MRVRADSAVPEIMRIGHTNKSETLIPQFVADEDFAYLDCPVRQICILRASVLRRLQSLQPASQRASSHYACCLPEFRRASTIIAAQRSAFPTL